MATDHSISGVPAAQRTAIPTAEIETALRDPGMADSLCEALQSLLESDQDASEHHAPTVVKAIQERILSALDCVSTHYRSQEVAPKAA